MAPKKSLFTATPSLPKGLEREIPSADRIDLLCAFVRWNGLRLLLPQLRAHVELARELRVITTTYTGSTERKALDALVEMGAKVKVSYETRSTRLHAKELAGARRWRGVEGSFEATG